LSNILLLNICWQLGNAKSLSVSQAFITIAKQAMPVGNLVSLKSNSDFSNILSLNIDWQFWRLLIA
jgi:hypothetical protein